MLIHMDGFDHYGNDETNMTDGVYDQVDAAFSLSTLNPRTGAYAVRRDSSATDNYIIKDLGENKTTVAQGIAVYIDRLPSSNDSYAIMDFRDSNGDIQLTLVGQSDGSVSVNLGGVSGATIASSGPNLLTPNTFNHIEFGAIASTKGTYTITSAISKQSSGWKWERLSTSDNSDFSASDYDDSGWAVGDAPFIDLLYEFDPGNGFAQEPGTDVGVGTDARIWIRRTFLASGNITEIILDYYHDDTGDAWINGTKVIDGAVYGRTLQTIPINLVNQGENSIAIRSTNVVQTGPDGAWVYADAGLTIETLNEDGTGQIEVRINGVTVLSDSNVFTISTDIESYRYAALCFGSSVAHGVTTDADDWYIWDDSGSWNNNFIGDRRCYLLKPNQDTNISDFDPSSGSFGYKMIDDESPDDDSTYIIAESYLQTGSPLSGTSEFEIENMPDGTSLISAVNVLSRASKTDNTSAEIYTSINHGLNSLSGISHTLTTSYNYYNDIYEFDPTYISSFTKSDIDQISISITADNLDSAVFFESPGIESPDIVSPDIVSPDIVSPGDETDPFFSSVTALLHMDGTNGSSSFIDETGRIWTAASGAVLTTSFFKFGTASGDFAPSSNAARITTPQEAGIFLNGDFTIECQMYYTASTSGVVVSDTAPASTNVQVFRINESAGDQITIYIDKGTGGYWFTATTANYNVNAFNHLALCRSGTTAYLFVNGVLLGTSTTNTSQNFYATSIGALYVNGVLNSPTSLNTYVDELRITNGVARYTSSFTPPTAAHPDM